MKLALQIAGSILGLVFLIGSYFVWAGLPPYKTERDHAREYRAMEIEVVGGQAQFYEYRQSLQRREIEGKEQQKREMLKNPRERTEWYKYHEKGLRKLKEDKEKTDKRIKTYEKRLEKR